MAIVYGTNASNAINPVVPIFTTTNLADVIYGYGGNDAILAVGGDDIINGGTGSDFMDGGTGDDTASYSSSATGVTVSLITGSGLVGDAQGDTLVSIENLTGSESDDLLIGDGGSNTLNGQGGDDTLKGGGGADILVGLNGNDVLRGGAGVDYLNGGGGSDTVAYSDSPAAVFIALDLGSADGGDAEGDGIALVENVIGSAYADQLWGDSQANVLQGLNGNDTLGGRGGADSMYGGNGNDLLWGGDGIDTLYGGAGNDSLRGENHADTLYGEAGNDTLWGGSGTNTLVGGTGDDTYHINNEIDTVVEAGGEGNDMVVTMVSYVLTPGADVETLTTDYYFGGSIDLTGNETGNVVRGTNGNNVINGGDGNDELTGRGGQDSFRFDTVLSEAFNIDAITDFDVADDTILLDQDIFSNGFGLGNISVGEFVIGAAALDGNDRIIYDDTTGALYYDADCAGGAAAIQFAELSPGLALTYLDFFVV